MDDAKHYVIISGVKGRKGFGAEVSVITATSKTMAHVFAADHYRKTYKLPANIHIDTYTAFTGNTDAEATVFMARLLEEERKRNAIKDAAN